MRPSLEYVQRNAAERKTVESRFSYARDWKQVHEFTIFRMGRATPQGRFSERAITAETRRPLRNAQSLAFSSLILPDL
jgi:hypothetical protein